MKRGSCSVCEHPNRGEIDRAHVAGESLRDLAERFGRNKDTIAKHVKEHIPSAVRAAAAADAGDTILNELQTLCGEAIRLQALAEKKKDFRTAMAGIRELRGLIELKARLLGDLRDREINITNVQIDAETAERMAQMYLARRARPLLGIPNPVPVESPREE